MSYPYGLITEMRETIDQLRAQVAKLNHQLETLRVEACKK